METVEVDDYVLGVILEFFHSGAGPSHTQVSHALESVGLGDNRRYDPTGAGASKQSRIREAFRSCRRDRERAHNLLGAILTQLSLDGSLADASSSTMQKLNAALAKQGWKLAADGSLEKDGPLDFEVMDRAALGEQLKRLNSAAEDPALLLGTAKDLIESIYKFVLEEIGTGVPPNANFPALQHLALERLNLLPQNVNADLPGGKELRMIYQAAQKQAGIINDLRNVQGTGHGRTLPTGIKPEAAIFVVKQGGLIAEMLLTKLDEATGNASVNM